MATTNYKVEKTILMLSSPSAWPDWLADKKLAYQDVWKYVDPEEKELPAPPKEPSPEIGSGSFAQYQWHHMQYTKVNTRLQELSVEISRTVDQKYRDIIRNTILAKEQLRILSDKASPTSDDEKLKLLDKYRQLQKPPAKRRVDQWITEWPRVVGLGIKAGLTELQGTAPAQAFIEAVARMLPDWANIKRTRFVEQVVAKQEVTGLERLCEELSYELQMRSPGEWGYSVNAASLEVAEETPSITEASNEQSATPGRKRKAMDQGPEATQESRKQQKAYKVPDQPCPCGKLHFWRSCWYLNPWQESKRKGWRPARRIQQIIDDWLQDDYNKQKLEEHKAIWQKEHEEKQADQGPIRIDGKAQATRAATFAVSLVASTLAVLAAGLATEAPEDRESLRDRWILDPGSDIHVINSEQWPTWRRQRLGGGERIRTGKSLVEITAWGSVTIRANTPQGLREIELTEVAFVDGFVTNLIGLARCRQQGVHFDSGRDLLYRKSGEVLAYLKFDGGHWLVDADPQARPMAQSWMVAAAWRPSTVRSEAVTTAAKAHKVMGHPGREILKRLTQATTGLQLVDAPDRPASDPPETCETCLESKLQKQISRVTSNNRATAPFQRLSIDLISLGHRKHRAEDLSGMATVIAHAVDEYTKWHEVEALTYKNKDSLSQWLLRLLRRIERGFNYPVRVIRSDNEKGFGSTLAEITAELGIGLEYTAPHTPEQNGHAEQAGGHLTMVARSLGIGGSLPEALADELYKTAAYLLNRTPTRSLGWKTPYEVVHGTKPYIGHLRPIGCKAFVLNHNIKRGDKLRSRALIGWLTGYDAATIYRVWLPTKDRVVRVRDVLFDTEKYFHKYAEYADEAVFQDVLRIAVLPADEPEGPLSVADLLPQRQRKHKDSFPHIAELLGKGGGAVGDQLVSNQYLPSPAITEFDIQFDHEANGLVPSTNRSSAEVSRSDCSKPEAANQDLSAQRRVENLIQRSQQEVDHLCASEQDALLSSQASLSSGAAAETVGTQEPSGEASAYVPDRRNNNAPRRRTLEFSEDNIIQGPRKRVRKERDDHSSFTAVLRQCADGDDGGREAYFHSFATALRPQGLPEVRIHQSQLPKEPQSYQELGRHPHGPQFVEAARKEHSDLWRMGCFERLKQGSHLRPVDGEVLPLMWVFTYKLDEDGYLVKHKARLVIRGDLQDPYLYGDTYAATMAGKAFRAIIAIANRFDLELMQYDAPNAFLNSKIDRLLYVEAPPGFRQDDAFLKILKALYSTLR